MPRNFRAAAPVDVWTPLHPSRTGEGGGSNYGVVARLQPGVSWGAVSEQLKALSRTMLETPGFPREYGNDFEERLVPLQKGLTADSRSSLLLTWGAVLIVLIIGCVNIAGLMLARSSARNREIATRMALGGSRAAIVRQLLTESLLLALGGGVLGIGIGVKALALLKELGAENLQLWHPIEINAPVMGVMLLIALLTSLLFGLAPALQTSRVDLRSVLVEGGRGVVGGGRRWSRSALVACEVALSLVLLVGAGLLVRTLAYLNGLDPGFQRAQRHHRAGLAAGRPLQDQRRREPPVHAEPRPHPRDSRSAVRGCRVDAAVRAPAQQRFQDRGRRRRAATRRRGSLYHARLFRDAADPAAPRPRIPRHRHARTARPWSIVSESFARKYYASHEALGGHLRQGRDTREIVGIVGDVQQHSGLGNFGPLSIEPTIYVPAAQTSDGYLQLIHTWFSPKWVIRSSGRASIEGPVQAAVASIDPQLPIARFKTMDDLRGRITVNQRYNATLFSVIAGLALLLAALGLAGLIGQSVTQRTHELGVRMALGASAGQAMLTTVKPGLALAAIGVAAGYALSRVAVRFLQHLLWGVRATDTTTFAVAAGILLLVAAIAAVTPSLRILRIDPARTLRDE